MRTACFDIETSHLHPEWGIILAAVVKEYLQKPIVFDIVAYAAKERCDDSRLVAALVEELGKYGTLVAHNGVFFDRQYINARAMHYGLPLVDPRGRIVDPVLVARRHFKLGSNTLDSLAIHLQVQTRKTHLDYDVWKQAAMDRKPRAMKYVIDHCLLDVQVLEEVLQKLVEARCRSRLIKELDAYGSAR